MKRILFVVICILSGVCGLMSCSEDGNNYPFPSDITDIKATPGPGSITLSWTLPEDENLKYVEVNYTIPETGKVYRKQISTFASSLLVDNLLHRYGEIDFKIQTYNEGNTGGNVFTISAQAESAAYVLQSRGDSFECIGYVYQCTFYNASAFCLDRR